MLNGWNTRIYEHRARWSARRLLPWIQPGDRVLDVGAGDCRLAQRIAERGRCHVTPIDVDDFNSTKLPLARFDGVHIPFADATFDVVMLVFVLHHARDAAAILSEASRVCRRHVLVIEDVNQTRWDRWTFRAFHRALAKPAGITLPFHELTPDEWSSVAASKGLHETHREHIGRQLGPIASRHILYVWAPDRRQSLAA